VACDVGERLTFYSLAAQPLAGIGAIFIAGAIRSSKGACSTAARHAGDDCGMLPRGWRWTGEAADWRGSRLDMRDAANIHISGVASDR